jgi:lipid II:glycine glycyltransferase (peptidoglycan interpeptide bridge formation enzyme)
MFVALREALLGKGVNVLRLVPNLPADDAASAAVAMLGEAGFDLVSGVPPYRTFRVDTHDNEEGIRARLRKSFRRDLKKAEETGLQIEHSHSEEAGRILESLYRILLDRKHFKGLDPQEFTQIQPALPEAEKLTFVVARLGGEPVAVLLSSNLGDTGIVLLAASNDRGLECGASYVIWYQALLAARKAGMTWCDLGGIDPEANPSVYQFKSRLGGDEIASIGAFESCASVGHKVLWSVGEKVHRLFK